MSSTPGTAGACFNFSISSGVCGTIELLPGIIVRNDYKDDSVPLDSRCCPTSPKSFMKFQSLFLSMMVVSTEPSGEIALKMRCLVLSLLAATSIASFAQTATGLSPKWEELTGPDFITAIHQAQDVCILPFGIIEKHGPHLPLGTDLINVRYATEHAAAAEYAVIFPAYYLGQIAEARHEPGTVSYSMHMQLDLLQETTDEMGRNGCKKIIIVN